LREHRDDEEAMKGESTSASATTATHPSAPLDVIWLDVPAGHIENDSDHYHVLDMHAGDPVRMSCRLDGHHSRGAQLHGDINVLPAGATARWFFAAQTNAVLLRLSPVLFEEAADALDLKPTYAKLTPTLRMRDPHIEHVGWLLNEERMTGNSRGRLWTESVAHAIAMRLVRRSRGISTSLRAAGRELPKWRLRSVCDYIEANLAHDLSLRELAEVAGFSVPHFKMLFTQATGFAVHRYVVERRVERARQLLLRGERPLADIALESGFAHQSHMNRCMHRLLGMNPGQLVTLCRK
jgi:AraC family transcriptional regulator